MENKKLPSVSAILSVLGYNKQILIGWTRKQALKGIDPNNITRESKNIGITVHEMINNYILERPEVDAPNKTVLNLFNSFLKYLDGRGIVGKTELKVVSDELGYWGIVDFVGELGGQKVIIDWKSGNHLHLENKIQLVAYQKLLERIYPTKDLRLVRLYKDSIGFEEVKITENEQELLEQIFYYAYRLYNLKKEVDQL